jgi:protein-disulfide isomerase
MNKGTAIVGFFLCFLTGMGLMYAVDRSEGGMSLSAEDGSSAKASSSDHASSPIPITKNDPQYGNTDALVTIVEVSDFECPFCSRVGATMKQIKETYKPDQVRIIWKHNPLPFHKNARPAHEAAATVMALAGSEAFWKFHDSAFANQKELTEANFEQWAVAAGVPAPKFNEAFKAKKYASKVDEDLALSKKIGISGTPGFRINGKLLSGAQPFPKFKEIIDAELAAAAELIKSGSKKNEVSLALTKKNFDAPAPAAGGDKPSAPAADDKTAWRIEVFPDDPAKGGKEPLVTIVEWSDFQCPFCSKVGPTLKQIHDTYKDDVRVVWKDNALPFHNRAKPAANLARAAYAKGGDAAFWKAHDALFENQKDLEDAGLEKISKTLGLDWATVKAAIDSNKYGDKIAKSMEQADAVEARGTPHFFVNGRRLTGAQPFERFKTVIDEELAKAKAMVAGGVARSNVYAEIMKTAKAPGTLDKKDVPPPGKDNPTKGGANAKVVINEFSDFQCPFCSRVGPTLKQVEKEYGDKVKIVWRNMPLPFHQDAPLAAEAAQEAFTQKGSSGFWAMHDKLFENQKALTRPDLDKYAQELGLDMGKFKAALDSRKHKGVIDADMAVAKQVGVNGTPAFTINGYFLSGAQPFEKFDKLIKTALAEK